MLFKTALRRYMKQNALSANKAAIDLGTSRRNILFWKRGQHEPPKAKRERLLAKMNGSH